MVIKKIDIVDVVYFTLLESLLLLVVVVMIFYLSRVSLTYHHKIGF